MILYYFGLKPPTGETKSLAEGALRGSLSRVYLGFIGSFGD